MLRYLSQRICTESTVNKLPVRYGRVYEEDVFKEEKEVKIDFSNGFGMTIASRLLGGAMAG